MKNFITRQILGVAALLYASASMAATVEVRPTDTGSPLGTAGSCSVVAGRCELNTTSTTFSVIVVGLSQPQTTGATLGMTFSAGPMSWTAADLSTVAPSAGQAFNALVATPDPGTTATPIAPVPDCNAFGDCILTALAPTSGTLPSGTVVAFVLKFTVAGPGTYLIDIIDDGGDFSWSASNGNPIPNTYTQARVNVTAEVPVPAAAWLLMSGLGALVGLKRFRRQ